MFVKSLAYVAFGGANVLSFALFEQGGVNGQLLGAAIFVATVATNAIAFWAVTKEKFKNYDEWKKNAQSELESMREKLSDAEGQVKGLKQFEDDFKNGRLRGSRI